MIKRKPKSPLQVEKDRDNIRRRNELFMEIWASKPHKCENCSEFLGKEPRTYMFDHLLEKSKYPEYEFEAENIMLTCLKCHDLRTRSFSTPIQDMRVNQAKKRFNLI